jgi:hypothetical protein
VLGRAIALYAHFRVALNNIFEPTGYALTLHAAPAVAFLETTPGGGLHIPATANPDAHGGISSAGDASSQSV